MTSFASQVERGLDSSGVDCFPELVCRAFGNHGHGVPLALIRGFVTRSQPEYEYRSDNQSNEDLCHAIACYCGLLKRIWWKVANNKKAARLERLISSHIDRSNNLSCGLHASVRNGHGKPFAVSIRLQSVSPEAAVPRLEDPQDVAQSVNASE